MNDLIENTQTLTDLDNYLTIDMLADEAGLSLPILKAKLVQMNLFDIQVTPLGMALQAPTTQYRFYEQEGHLEGEWLVHRDILKHLTD